MLFLVLLPSLPVPPSTMQIEDCCSLGIFLDYSLASLGLHPFWQMDSSPVMTYVAVEGGLNLPLLQVVMRILNFFRPHHTILASSEVVPSSPGSSNCQCSPYLPQYQDLLVDLTTGLPSPIVP